MKNSYPYKYGNGQCFAPRRVYTPARRRWPGLMAIFAHFASKPDPRGPGATGGDIIQFTIIVLALAIVAGVFG